MAACRFCLRDLEARQHPIRVAERGVAFDAQLHHLPARNRLPIHEAKFGISLGGIIGGKIITQAGRVEACQDVTLGHAQQQLPYRRLANVQLHLCVDCQFRLAEVIGQQLRHAQFGQHVVRLHPQSEVGAGKTEREPLAGLRAEERPGGIALGKLLRRNLRQPGRLHDFEPHRAFVHHAKMSRESRRAFRLKLDRIDRLRESAQFGLQLHLQRDGVFLWLVEVHDQPAVRGIGHRLDIPREHARALHACDIALPAQQQHDAVQLALHDFEIHERKLAH